MLEGEGHEDEDDEEAREAKEEMYRKYARRQLGSNADRYEEEPELDSEGTNQHQYRCRISNPTVSRHRGGNKGARGRLIQLPRPTKAGRCHQSK